MRIAYLMPTRGNPRRAAAVIECARSLMSGKHEVEFVLGVDRDDKASIQYFFHEYPEITVSVADRQPTLGSVWNRLAFAVPADAYAIMADDVFPAAPHWDEGIAQFINPEAVGVLAWNDLGSPNQPTYPVMSAEWVRVTGRVYTDLFPFWFDDSWIAEVWSFATGNWLPIVSNLYLASKKGKTKRMRELGFWWNVFNATRPARLHEGAIIRKACGLPPLSDEVITQIWTRWAARDTEMLAKVEQIEADLAEPSEPGVEYFMAKDRAVQLMEHLNA